MQYDPVHLEVTNNNNDVGWCAVTETFAISEVKVKETANGGNLKKRKKEKEIWWPAAQQHIQMKSLLPKNGVSTCFSSQTV